MKKIGFIALVGLIVLAMAALALGACSNPDPEAPTGPAVAMPGIDYAVANSTPGEAERAMSHKTWMWTRGGGPALTARPPAARPACTGRCGARCPALRSSMPV